MRRVLIATLTFLMMLMAATFAQAAPNVVLNGQPLTFDVPPTIENGRTLVPLRAIFEPLGAQVQWNGETQIVTATKTGTEIKLIIGGQAFMNGQPVNLDVPAKVVEGRTMVPLRFVGEALGCEVGWDGNTQTITIASTVQPGNNMVEVHFIDVGQADAIYISLPNNNDILIDGGNKADGQAVVNYLKSRSVDDIELLIATHPHEDHIGGLPAVLDAFNVERIIDSGATANTNIYKEYAAMAAAEGLPWEPDNSQTFTFEGTVLQLFTGSDTWKDINDYSVVCRLDTGDIEFLFTGDAEGPAEAALTGQLDAEILKVGHHGSRTSTSSTFISKVNPVVAIISVGAGNSYGHPAPETLQRLAGTATVYRTDSNGNIIISTDGKTYNVSAEKSSPQIALPQVPPVQTQINETPATPNVVSSPAPQADEQGVTVYVTKTGEKYHRDGCRYLSKSKIPITLSKAKSGGYTPCSVCGPPR